MPTRPASRSPSSRPVPPAPGSTPPGSPRRERSSSTTRRPSGWTRRCRWWSPGSTTTPSAGHEGIIANPNCTTMVLMMAVGPLHRAATVRHMVATTYQSVSGAGQTGMDVLAAEIELLAADPGRLAARRLGRPWRGPVPAADRVQRHPPRRPVHRRPGTPRRSGSWSTRPARSWATANPGGADLRAGTGDGGPLDRRHARLRAGHGPGRGARPPLRRPRASRSGATTRCPPRSTAPGSTPRSSAGYGEPWAGPAEYRCGRSATTCARGRRSTPSRSPSCFPRC